MGAKRRKNEFFILPDRGWVEGIVLFGFVFLQKRTKTYAEVRLAALLNHERIHVRQWLEMLLIPFLLWYSIEFLIRWGQYRNWQQAYRNISFEREAYAQERNPDYLSGRRCFAWTAYLHYSPQSARRK